jgi:hypothetical protein
MTPDRQADVLTPRADLLFRRMGDAGVLVRLETGQIYELNSTAARVWELVAEGRTRTAVIDALTQEFDRPADAIAGEVTTLLDELGAQGLLVTR